MILNEIEQKIKEDIHEIFSGKYDNQTDIYQLETLKQMSFILNHISIEDDNVESYSSHKGILFSYEEFQVNLNLPYHRPFNVWSDDMKNHIYYTIRNSIQFKSAYKQFCRDFKLNTIL